MPLDSRFTGNIGSPPVFFGPEAARPYLIVDQRGVFLTDPDGNFIGFDGNWGRGGPLARIVYALPAETRDFSR